jgi:hypothetical protein
MRNASQAMGEKAFSGTRDDSGCSQFPTLRQTGEKIQNNNEVGMNIGDALNSRLFEIDRGNPCHKTMAFR